MWFLTIQPIIQTKDFWMYWISMVASIWSILVVEAIEKLILPKNIYWMDDLHYPVEAINNFLQHPLLEYWMVISTVRLRMGFVGWLNKLGIYFTGMTSSLNQIGDNSVWLMRYSSKLNGRRNNPMIHLFGVMVNQIVGMGSQLGSLALLVTVIVDSTHKTSLVYLIVLLFIRLANLQPIHGRYIAPIVMSKPLHRVIYKEDEKTFDWKINTRDLPRAGLIGARQ